MAPELSHLRGQLLYLPRQSSIGCGPPPSPDGVVCGRVAPKDVRAEGEPLEEGQPRALGGQYPQQ